MQQQIITVNFLLILVLKVEMFVFGKFQTFKHMLFADGLSCFTKYIKFN